MSESIEFKSPEEEIQYLEKRILEKRKEAQERTIHEVARESIEEHIKKETPVVFDDTLSVDNSAQGDDIAEIDSVVSKYVSIAFSKGVIDAVRQVRETHNPHLIDAFHDALTDRFVYELKSKGLIDPH